jgi:hypothetical protein
MDKLDFTPAEKPRVIAWVAAHFEQMKAEKSYTIEIKERKNRRSLDANAYAWALLSELAFVMHESKEELYKRYIKDCGGNCETVCVQEQAAKALCEHWSSHGLGWTAETFPSKIRGCVNVNLYYGSSVFDTMQMSALIDSIVQDCKAVGIKTLDDMEIDKLIEAWEGGTDG